jgi:hypothetical protein
MFEQLSNGNQFEDHSESNSSFDEEGMTDSRTENIRLQLIV